jgi:phage terminase large subunit
MKVNRKTEVLRRSTKRYNVLKGGSGSGKSFGATQVEVMKAFENKEKTLFVRKVARTLRESCFSLTKTVLSDGGFIRGKDYQYNKTDMSFEFSSGSQFIMAGLDDVDKLKSIAGITRIFIEEFDQLDETDFTQLDLRLRGNHIHNPQITGAFNPVSVSHWLKKRFFDNTDHDTTCIIESNYSDNAFLDQGYIDMLNRLVTLDENMHRIYVLNEWGLVDTSKLFVRDYNRRKHVVSTNDYNSELDIYLAFDLNYDPYCLVIQFDENGIYVLREYHEKSFTLPMTVGDAISDYPANWPQVYIVNGDVSGSHSRNITDNTTSYEIIKDALSIGWDNFHVPTTNPSHISSRQLCNLIFKHGNIRIHESCKNLISDIEQVEVNDVGSLDPYKKEHPERSGWLDALRYHINSEHSDFPKKLGIANILNK